MKDLMKDVKKAAGTMFDTVTVRIKYRDRCLGQVAEMLEARMAKVEALVRRGKMPTEVRDEIYADNREKYADAEAAKRMNEGPDVDGADDAEKQITNVFWRDTEGVYIEARIVKSALRDIFSQLSVFTKQRGSKGTHNLGMYIEPDRLYFERDGERLTDVDGVQEVPAHISDASGKRAVLTRSEFIDGAELAFTVKLIKGGKLPKGEIPRALALLQDAGLSGKRSQGYGKLDIVSAQEEA